MQTERRVAANPQTKPTDLGCESADKWLNFENGPVCSLGTADNFVENRKLVRLEMAEIYAIEI